MKVPGPEPLAEGDRPEAADPLENRPPGAHCSVLRSPEFLPEQTSILFRWIRFNAVGVLGFGFQLCVLAGLSRLFHLRDLTATALSVEFTLAHNFLLHETWTWSDRLRPWKKTPRCRNQGAPAIPGSVSNGNQAQERRRLRVLVRFLRFQFSNGLVSLLGNLFFVDLLTRRLEIPLLPAAAASILICSILNFLCAEFLVFKSSRAERRGPRPWRWKLGLKN